MDDEFEIEVTDLNTGATNHHPLADAATPSGSEPPAAAIEAEHDENEPPIAPQRTRWLQRMRTAIVSGIVLLVVVLVVALNPAAKSALGTALHLPTPTPTAKLVPGTGVVYLLRGVPWTTVTLDGKQPKNISFVVGLTVLNLRPGRHTLIVTQAPFPSLHCTISAPASSRDTCPLIPLANANTPELGDLSNVLPGSRVVDLGVRFDRLSQTDRDSLVATVTEAVQTAESAQIATLQPGDHYQRNDGSIAIAQNPLQGKLAVTLIPPNDSVPSDDDVCTSFCDIPGVGTVGGYGSWPIRVALQGNWHITDSAGKVIADHPPLTSSDSSHQDFGSAVQFSAVGVRWVGSWQVTPVAEFGPPSYSLCQPAIDALSSDFANSNTPDAYNVNCLDTSPTSGLECVVAVSVNNGPDIYVYYHFGALVAIDSTAHMAFPDLPMASEHEHVLARQIIDSQPG